MWVFLFFACYTQFENLHDQDFDKDGFTSFEGDCNDEDASLNPRDEDRDGYRLCACDCSDLDSYVYIGIAYLEEELGCMSDADGDGSAPELPSISEDADCDGVLITQGCDDTNPLTVNDMDCDGVLVSDLCE